MVIKSLKSFAFCPSPMYPVKRWELNTRCDRTKENCKTRNEKHIIVLCSVLNVNKNNDCYRVRHEGIQLVLSDCALVG